MILRDFWVRVIKRPMVRDTITITVLRVFARGIGALIPFFIAAWFGVTSQTDAFFFAYGIVIFFTGIFSSVLESFIVPFVAEFKAKNEGDVTLFVYDILISGAVITIAMSLICLAVLKPALAVSTKFSPETIALVFRLFAEITPLLLFTALAGVLSGALNADKKFRIPAVAPAIRAVTALGVIFFTKDAIGIHSIPLGYAVGEALRLAVLFRAVFQNCLMIPHISLGLMSNVADFFKTVVYRTAGMLAIAFTPIIDRMMASWMGSGSVTIIDYADKIYSIPVILIVEGFLIAVLSHWSAIYYGGPSGGELKKEAVKTCMIMLPVSILIAAAVFLSRGFAADNDAARPVIGASFLLLSFSLP